MSRLARLVAAAALACVVALGAGSASAMPVTSGPPEAPQHFTVLFTVGNVRTDDVTADGPVSMLHGTDRETTNSEDFLSDGMGNTVRVVHEGFPTDPGKDLVTCTMTVTKDDAHWEFTPGGTGAWKNARGSGVFILRAMFGFSRLDDGRCALEIIPQSALADIGTLNASPFRKYVEFAAISIRGSGTAFVPGG